MGEIRKATLGAEMQLPVMIGSQDYTMGTAQIDIDGNDVTIVIKSEGQDGLMLANFLMGGEVSALSFSYMPVRPRNQ